MKFYFLCLCLNLNSFLIYIVNAKIQVENKCEDKCEGLSKIAFHGSNLFGKNGYPNKCFTQQQVALLTTLRIFQLLIPKDFPKKLLDDNLANSLINYFYQANCIILKEIKDHEAQRYAEEAFYDTVGGYLNYYIIPLTKYSFYAGSLSLEIAQKIVRLHKHSKEYLNTNGNGWMPPIETKPMCKIDKIDMKAIKEEHCSQLTPNDDTNNERMLIALPKLDNEQGEFLTHIWLPFKHKKWYNLQSDCSAYIIFKYFAIVSKCYLDEEMGDDIFHDCFKNFYHENLEIHLNDSILYPGFGAILRVLETINDKHARNLFTKNVGYKFNNYKKYPENLIDNPNLHDNLVKRQEKNWIEKIVDKKKDGRNADDTDWDKYKKMGIKGAIFGVVTIIGTALLWFICKRWFKGVFSKMRSEKRFEAGMDYPYQKFSTQNVKRYQQNTKSDDNEDDEEDEDYYYDDEEDTLFNQKSCMGHISEQTNNRINNFDEISGKKAEGNQITISSGSHISKMKNASLREFNKQCVLSPNDIKEIKRDIYNMSSGNVKNNRGISEIKKPPNRMETSSSESSHSLKKYPNTRIPRKVVDNKKISSPKNYISPSPGPSKKHKNMKLDMISEKPDIKNTTETRNRGKGIGKLKLIRNEIKPKKEEIDLHEKKSIGRTTSWETDLEN